MSKPTVFPCDWTTAVAVHWSALTQPAELTFPSPAAFLHGIVEPGKIIQMMYILLLFSNPWKRQVMWQIFFQIYEIRFMKIYKDILNKYMLHTISILRTPGKKFLSDLSVRNGCPSPEQLALTNFLTDC